eukprot:TRINITY_DN9332_c0_g1_i1.p1 TRINITY_DN9332_c0_g1~~TRINITY_DN9332_c0_g1_i1.p1  ORF type:complete len:140 (+),score=16.42 TRINITY_DN9332_c0_g1_i1:26-445(+)
MGAVLSFLSEAWNKLYSVMAVVGRCIENLIKVIKAKFAYSAEAVQRILVSGENAKYVSPKGDIVEVRNGVVEITTERAASVVVDMGALQESAAEALLADAKARRAGGSNARLVADVEAKMTAYNEGVEKITSSIASMAA